MSGLDPPAQSERPFVELGEATRQIVYAGRFLDSRGWAPATAGNYSLCMDDERIAITVSGRHKGRLCAEDVMVVDSTGRAMDARRPSAETALHTLMYRLDRTIGAVLHTHSVTSTVLGMSLPQRAAVELSGYELLKAFDGIETHEARVTIPIFENTQDMLELRDRVVARWQSAPFFGYLIRGHGLYAWGRTMDDALRAIDALEFLFACEIERGRRA